MPRSHPIPTCLLLAALSASSARAQAPAAGLEAWWRPAPAGPPATDPPAPSSLTTVPLESLYRGLPGLDDPERVSALRARMLQGSLRQVLVADPQLWVGAQEHVRRRLVEAAAAGAPYPPVLEAEAQEELARGRLGTSLSWLRTRDRFPASRAAGLAALRHAEALVEDGQLAAASFVLRRQPPLDELAARGRHLRALPAEGLSWRGQHGLPPPPRAPRLLWSCAAPVEDPELRALEADAHRVYLVDALGVAARSRRTGQLLWRATRRGPRRETHLALGHGLLLESTPQRLQALRVRDGSLAWELPLRRSDRQAVAPTDRFHAVSADASGFLAIATEADTRRVLALGVDGTARWETRLWSAPAAPAGLGFAPRLRPRAPAESPTPEDPGPTVRAEPVSASFALGDGRVATLPGVAFVTLDGMLASLGTLRGELRWVHARVVGRAVAGTRHHVELSAWPDAVHAIVRGGLSLRVDPLSGRPLPANVAPPSPSEHPESAECYPLINAHDACAWRYPSQPRRLQLTLGRRALPGLDCKDVSGPGVAWGSCLVLPGPEGLLLIDPARQRRTRIDWSPGVDPGWLQTRAGLLLVSSPTGLGAYGDEAPVPEPAPWTAAPSPTELLAALDHPAWRRRAEARQRLGRLAPEALANLEPGSSQAARELLDDARQRARSAARWARLVPGLSQAEREQLCGRPSPESLQAAVSRIEAGDHTADLRAELSRLALEGPLVAWPLARELLLRSPQEQGLLVLEIRGADQAQHALVAAALLVELAACGGDLDPLQRVLTHPDLTLRSVVELMLAEHAALRRRLVPDDAAWEQRVEQAQWTLAARWGGILPPTPQQVAETYERIVKALADE